MSICCVIGGGGFIGSVLVNQLIETGRDVRVIGLYAEPENALQQGVEYLAGDYGDNTFIDKALQNVDEIIDLAYSTVPKTSFDDPVNDILSNLPQAVNLYQKASELPIRKLLFISSGGTVYGKVKSLPIAEDHPTNPISPYGITKLAIEKYAGMFYALKNLPIVCLRPSNAYGEHQRPYTGQGFIATAIASVLEGKELTIFGDKGTIRDYIHVEDLARGIVAALEHGKNGEVYNIGTATGKSNRDVIDAVKLLSEPVGFKIILRNLPLREFDVPSNILSYKKINQDTGWSPKVNFEEGIKRTWLYLKHMLRK